MSEQKTRRISKDEVQHILEITTLGLRAMHEDLEKRADRNMDFLFLTACVGSLSVTLQGIVRKIDTEYFDIP